MRALLACLLFALFAAGPALAAVDINTATAEELESLPGIGPSKAAAIIQYRTEHGPFASVDALDDVSGIGPATLAALRDQVVAGKGGAPAASGAAAPSTTSASTTTNLHSAEGGHPTSSAAPASPPSSTAGATSSGSKSAGCPVNINTADTAGLMGLPGIGASKAAAIAQYRVDNGPFASCDALDNVSGIGSATLAGLRDCCVVK